MVWSVTYQEYKEAISNVEPRWVGETMSDIERDEAYSPLVNMVLDFQKILAKKCSNPENEAAFQADL